MASHNISSFKSLGHVISIFCWMAFGAFLTALALEVFLIPNDIIDGGIVGISMICAHLFGNETLPFFLVVLNIPFIILAYKHLGKYFVIQMLSSILMLAGFIALMKGLPTYEGDAIEVIFSGGCTLGVGIGMIIRNGGALDGTEIVGIIINRRFGFTVGQAVLFFNTFIFTLAGFIYNDWHTAVQSLMTFVVAIKIMDIVIVGLEETKAAIIISNKSKAIGEAVMHELGLGLTVFYGRGGYSGGDQEILYVTIERLQLAELKEIVHREDSAAFIAIENLHEVVNGRYESRQIESEKEKSTSLNPLSRLWNKK